MPPKKMDVHHITFHFYRSAVLLSAPGSTTIAALKAQLLPALKPLSADLPFPPSSAADIKLFEERTVEGAEGMRDLEDDEAGSGGSIQSLGWKRWKRVFVSFKGENGLFEEPVYTIPDVDDEMPEGAEGM